MKPVLLVDGKELEVMEISYRDGQVVSVVVEVEKNVYETYSCRSYLFVSDNDKSYAYGNSLKFKNQYDDLIAHLDEMLKEANDDLTEIAIEAMESNESGLPFNSRLAESQKYYQSEKQRVMGMIDVVEEVKAFAEGFYDDEKSAELAEGKDCGSTTEQLRNPLF